MWFELAARLHTPVQRCMVETSSRDFADWKRYRIIEMNTPDRVDYYLMNIAAEIRRVNIANPRNVKLADFVLPFTEDAPKGKKPPTKKEIEARTEKSKSAWFALAGVKPPKE